MNASSEQIADFLVDRRALMARLRRWRFISVLALLAGLLLAALGLSQGSGSLVPTPIIARLKIEGLIADDADMLRLIDAVRNSKAAAVLVEIDSPGGTTTGAEKLFLELRHLAEAKPVVTVLGTLAASGGYIAALAGDHVVAERNSLVGSIGVLFQYPNFSHLLDTVGVKVEEVKSSPLKAAPNGFEPTSPEARKAIADLVADSYDWFKNLVKTRRSLSDAELQNVSDGRVFTGHQAIGLKLVDELGGEREAVEWLVREKNIKANLPIVDWKKERVVNVMGLFSVIDGFLRLGTQIGLWPAVKSLSDPSSITPQGLLALWQP